jgi:hypothetical protein
MSTLVRTASRGSAHLIPPYSQPCSPEWNPQENLWDEIREQYSRTMLSNPRTASTVKSIRLPFASNATQCSPNPSPYALLSQVTVIWKWQDLPKPMRPTHVSPGPGVAVGEMLSARFHQDCEGGRARWPRHQRHLPLERRQRLGEPAHAAAGTLQPRLPGRTCAVLAAEGCRPALVS